MQMYLIGFFALCFSLLQFQSGAVSKSVNYIHGNVRDKRTKEPLARATIRFFHTNLGVISDSKGNYTLTIPDSLLRRKIIIQFEYVGYENLKKEVDFKTLPVTVDG